jgi:hypothetical protein
MKTLKPAFIITLLSLIVVITVLGCSKGKTENKLQGRWSRVFVDDLNNTSLVEDWEFMDDKSLRIHSVNPGVADTNYIEGMYTVASYKEVALSGDAFPTNYLGSWRITKINKEVLVIAKEEGGLNLLEFVKD